MTLTDIVTRVQKLLRLAGNNSSVEEASAAAAKAQALIDEHNLSQAMLDLDPSAPRQSEPDEPIRDFAGAPLDAPRRASGWRRTRGLDRWRHYLAHYLAQANSCRLYLQNGLDITLVGRASDVETVRYLYAWLVRETERLTDRAGAGMGRTWRNNFRLGVVDAIAAKLRDQHKASVNAFRQAQTHDNPAALVLVNNAIARVEARGTAVDQWMKQNLRLRGRSASQSGTYDAGARAAGRAAGATINLGAKAGLGAGARGQLK